MIWPVKKVPADTAPSLPIVRLTGPRVYLRPPTLTDWPQWAVVREDNQDMLQQWEPTWPENCLSEEFFIRRLRRQLQDWQRQQAYSFLIFTQDDDVLIGGVNLNNVALGAARCASLGYWLDRDYQRQGYMGEALDAIIQWAFGMLKLHRINAACLPANTASINVLKRLGFDEEGFAKSYYRINGMWEDHVLFGKVTEAE